MTAPDPAPIPIGWPGNDIVWCSCGQYYATVKKPLCPVCDDEAVRAER